MNVSTTYCNSICIKIQCVRIIERFFDHSVCFIDFYILTFEAAEREFLRVKLWQARLLSISHDAPLPAKGKNNKLFKDKALFMPEKCVGLTSLGGNADSCCLSTDDRTDRTLRFCLEPGDLFLKIIWSVDKWNVVSTDK